MTQRSESDEGLVKVFFDIPEKDGSVTKTESLWAKPVGGDRYRLRNVPFLAFGFSEHDVITAKEDDGTLRVTGIAIRGGHSTYRLVLPEDTNEEKFLQDWVPLKNSAALTNEPHAATLRLMFRLPLTSTPFTTRWKRERAQACGSSKRATAATCLPRLARIECQLM